MGTRGQNSCTIRKSSHYLRQHPTTSAPAHVKAQPSDVVFLIDESGSMGNDQEAVADLSGDIFAALDAETGGLVSNIREGCHIVSTCASY